MPKPSSHGKKDFQRGFLLQENQGNTKGVAPIYVRITANGQSTEIYTQCQVEPKKWNQRLERIPFRDKVSMRINQIVASYRANILAAYDQLI